MFTNDDEAPRGNGLYIEAWDEVDPELQSVLQNRHLSFDDIVDEGLDKVLRKHIEALTDSALPMSEWMADPMMRQTPIQVVSSFTWDA
jgi:hypothetical protein